MYKSNEANTAIAKKNQTIFFCFSIIKKNICVKTQQIAQTHTSQTNLVIFLSLECPSMYKQLLLMMLLNLSYLNRAKTYIVFCLFFWMKKKNRLLFTRSSRSFFFLNYLPCVDAFVCIFLSTENENSIGIVTPLKSYTYIASICSYSNIS